MNRRIRSRGQGVVEYILITALISLAAVAIFRTFRADVAEAYRRAGATLLASFDDGGAPAAP
jgi:Flp pilus assembly pilin Flp